jgi:hypothetical protein
MAAGQILFECDAIAFLHAEALRRGTAQLGDRADGLVPEDQRALRLRIFQVVRPVAAADAAELDLEQPAIRWNSRGLELAHLGTPDVGGNGGADRCHGESLSRKADRAHTP